jgi:hypothetical protein
MRTTLAAAIALSLPSLAAAQLSENMAFQMTYSMSAPTANSHDFISQFSFRGFGVGWHKATGRADVGIDLAWTVLNKEITGTTTLNQVDVTGTQFRYLNSFPFLATVDFNLQDRHGAHAFLGLSMGTYYIERAVDVGLWSLTDWNWHFGLAPSLGLSIPLQGQMRRTAFLAIARYNYAFAAGDAPYQSWLGIDVGFKFLP